MSEISSYDTDISIPSLAERRNVRGNLMDREPRETLLKQALMLVAQDHKGRITDNIRDCDGETLPCVVGVTTPEFPLGVGVSVSRKGDVSFVYDAHGDHARWGRRIAGEIAANYNAIAVRAALMAMNLEVQVREGRDKRGSKMIHLEGRI